MTGDKAAILTIETTATAIKTINGVSLISKKRSCLRKPAGVAFHSMHVNQGCFRSRLVVPDVGESRTVAARIDIIRSCKRGIRDVLRTGNLGLNGYWAYWRTPVRQDDDQQKPNVFIDDCSRTL